MSMVLTGSRTFIRSFAIVVAAVVPPAGRLKILPDSWLVWSKGSVNVPTDDVAPVLHTPDGMESLSMPSFSC